MTIAEQRRNAVKNMCEEFKIPAEAAKNLMSRYYNLAAADKHLAVLKNDSSTANQRQIGEMEETTVKRREKLIADLKKYGLTLEYFGCLPTICPVGSTRTAVPTFFYE